MTSLKDVHFPPTQQRILDVLADGKSHEREELRKALNDDLASFKNLNVHLVQIRRVLRPLGYDILCVIRNRKLCYQQIIPYIAPLETPKP